jgi:hypothetical protein
MGNGRDVMLCTNLVGLVSREPASERGMPEGRRRVVANDIGPLLRDDGDDDRDVAVACDKTISILFAFNEHYNNTQSTCQVKSTNISGGTRHQQVRLYLISNNLSGEDFDKGLCFLMKLKCTTILANLFVIGWYKLCLIYIIINILFLLGIA